MIKLIIIILFILVTLFFLLITLGYLLADNFKPLQKFYCRIGWHCHFEDYIYEYNDGCSDHCRCKWCGYKGMIDSQGNLF